MDSDNGNRTKMDDGIFSDGNTYIYVTMIETMLYLYEKAFEMHQESGQDIP